MNPTPSRTTASAIGSRNARLPRQQRRRELLRAARQTFVTLGYHAAAMDDIAARAGVTKPVLYQHFSSKRDLYLAVLDDGAKKFLGAINKGLASSNDNEQRVTSTIRAYFGFIAHADEEYRLLFESDLVNAPDVADRVRSVEDGIASMVAGVIAEDTRLDPAESLLLAGGLLGMAQVAARRWIRDGKPMPAKKAADLVSGLAWRGISGYPLAAEAAEAAEHHVPADSAAVRTARGTTPPANVASPQA